MEKTTHSSKRRQLFALWLSILVAAVASAANGAPLDDAKAAGQIGEGVDGYVHLVDNNAPADVKALVIEINQKRRDKYQDIATKRGASVDDVAALAGAKLVERAPAGQYILDSTGKWRKK